MAKKTRKNKNVLFAIIILIVIIMFTIGLKELIIRQMYKKQYSEYISKYSSEYEIDENLIYALIKAESNFKCNAVSTSNAKGLMQLMYPTAEEIANKNGIELTEENILEPDVNINLGTIYISELIEKYKSIEVALAAYNAGSGNVDKWIKNGIIKADGSDIEKIPYKETNTYVRKIMRDYKIYTEINKS